MMDMFSMFTADVAAKHGHEFSRSTTPPNVPAGLGAPLQNRPKRLPRHLSVLPRSRPQQLAVRSRPRPQSMKRAMAELKEDPEEERASEEEEMRMIEAKIRSFTIPGAFQDTPPGSTRTSSERQGEGTGKAVTIPSTEASDVDVVSIVKSTSEAPSTAGEDTTYPSQVRRNIIRSKVVYRLGRPVRTDRKHYLRPKCLLQIQEAAGGKFHRPVFDVVPGSRFNPRTKIGQKLRRLKRSKDGTGADDLVIVRSEHRIKQEDSTPEPDEKEVDHEHETLNGQEVIGTIQPAEQGPSAYISIGETVYEAILDASGFSYSLEDVNDKTKRVKWYVPKAKRAAAPVGAPREFSFTSIQPDSKRHPILASMSEGHLEFNEEYTSPAKPDTIIKTDEAMQRLLVVSGMWVYFCEGWSKHYDFNMATATATRPVPVRAQSMRSITRRGIRDVLRSPSCSPCPSIRRASDESSNVETRSRKALHDSAATSTVVSPAGTFVKHPNDHAVDPDPTENPTREQSPEVWDRGRRRWSASLTTRVRRLSDSVRSSRTKERTPVNTVITADFLHVDDLPTPAVIEEHALQKVFIAPYRRPKSMVLTDIRPKTRDRQLELPLERSAAQPLIQQTSLQSGTVQMTPAFSEGTSSTQLDGPSEDSVVPVKPMPHRLGLGDLARPCDNFTPQHQRAESSSSSDGDDEMGHSAGWWSQYDRLALKSPGGGSLPIV